MDVWQSVEGIEAAERERVRAPATRINVLCFGRLTNIAE